MQPIRPSTSLRNNVFETGKLFDGRGDKVSSNAREGERRVARGTLRTKIPSLSTAYTVYLFESREREYKTEEFVRNGTGLFSIIIIIQESWTSIDRDIFFCFFPKKCAFQGKIPKFERSVNSMIDQWPPLSDLYPAYSEIADILLTASRPIVPRSMNRFANAFPFRRRRIGLAISAQPIGISRATPRTATKFILPQNAWSSKDKGILLEDVDSFRAYRKNYISHFQRLERNDFVKNFMEPPSPEK